jgi:ribosomal protein S18 acetylase RimI-like enzyme
MYYDDDNLIGYIGICRFGGNTLEVNGMVHPEYRRRGIFKTLFSLVKDEWYKRESQRLLLLCDHHSSSGLEFIRHSGNVTHDHSEYEMFLRSGSKQDVKANNVGLKKAMNLDAKEIAWQNSVYFDKEYKEEDLLLPEEEEKCGTSIYLAEVDNKVIGKVHLEVSEGNGGIYGLGVLPEYRNKGYGREILVRAIEKLKERNLKDIMLQVAVKNNRALNLYCSCGFEITSTMDYFEMQKE